MIQRFAVPVGAGAVSALLFALTVKGTPLAFALAFLAPMPLMIAAFGWGALGGLVAAVAAASAVVAVFDLQSALSFVLVVAVSAWVLPTFAVLPRYAPPWRRGDAEAPARTPVGAVVALAAALGALAGLAGLATLIIGNGGYEAGLQALISELTPMAEQAFEGLDVLPDGVSARDVAEYAAKLAPLATATVAFLILCVNLYAAGRSTGLAHRLPRPWPDLPTEFVLPRPLAVVAVIAAAAAIALPEPIDQFARVLAGPLAAAYALQGFAVLHALSRGLPLRPLLIAVLYLCCAIRAGWTLPLIALVGLVDSAVNLRGRAAARRSKI
jgi:hypothetical protein